MGTWQRGEKRGPGARRVSGFKWEGMGGGRGNNSAYLVKNKGEDERIRAQSKSNQKPTKGIKPRTPPTNKEHKSRENKTVPKSRTKI